MIYIHAAVLMFFSTVAINAWADENKSCYELAGYAAETSELIYLDEIDVALAIPICKSEFEDHACKVLGVSGDRVREVLGERGHDTDADFEAAYESAGAAFTRQKMSHILCSLELVYYETEIGRQLTEDERLERYTNWNIGLNMETLNAYYYTAVGQEEAEEKKSEAE